MSTPEPMATPEATQRRVRRLIQQLARRIKARRLASLTSSNTSQVGTGNAPGSATNATAGKIRQAGQRALLRRLVKLDRLQAAASRRRVRGTRHPVGLSRGRS